MTKFFIAIFIIILTFNSKNVIAESIVAVVGNQPITSIELKARLDLINVLDSKQDISRQKAFASVVDSHIKVQFYQEKLSHIPLTIDEDKFIQNIAEANRLTVKQVNKEVDNIPLGRRSMQQLLKAQQISQALSSMIANTNPVSDHNFNIDKMKMALNSGLPFIYDLTYFDFDSRLTASQFYNRLTTQENRSCKHIIAENKHLKYFQNENKHYEFSRDIRLALINKNVGDMSQPIKINGRWTILVVCNITDIPEIPNGDFIIKQNWMQNILLDTAEEYMVDIKRGANIIIYDTSLTRP
ncbi:MAG: hypothetical protein JJV93_03260 [Alphaproteobacteria bacterium]|nr:hypothetical protein [Alphaproteobacteria bacterium]MBL0718246.1 hypothetical protein [Alphaproteobacteria bacterium]